MFNNKNVLVVGLATSGIPTVKVLNQLGALVTITDIKKKSDLENLLIELDGLFTKMILGEHPEDMGGYDLVVLSPGVPVDLPFLKRARELHVEIIGEIELSFRLLKGRFVAITGTNGKTTTTSLLYEMYKADGQDAYAVGNIGLPPIFHYGNSTDQTVFVTEVSSFQLESIDTFRPKVAAILNVTPDHLNRHKTMDAYIDAKCRIYENMNRDNYLILNGDNLITANLMLPYVNPIYFSRTDKKNSQIYISDGIIFVREGCHAIEIIDTAEILIPGAHNLENAMAAIGMAYYDDVSLEAIRHGLKTFRGVEHRIEPVATIKGVMYYNDSKGTNTDSTIKAIEAMTKPTILIAGGMDKGSTFNEMVDAFQNRIIHVILYGETKYIIANTCKLEGFDNITIVDTLKEATLLSMTLSKAGDNVLLSPACASWDMYPNFEARGNEFKSIVLGLKQND